MTTTEINWDRIHDVSEVITPAPFPEGWGHRLDTIDHGSRVVDVEGNRFLLMGWGSVQGSVILRDRYRRQFHADGGMRLRVTR